MEGVMSADTLFTVDEMTELRQQEKLRLKFGMPGLRNDLQNLIRTLRSVPLGSMEVLYTHKFWEDFWADTIMMIGGRYTVPEFPKSHDFLRKNHGIDPKAMPAALRPVHVYGFVPIFIPHLSDHDVRQFHARTIGDTLFATYKHTWSSSDYKDTEFEIKEDRWILIDTGVKATRRMVDTDYDIVKRDRLFEALGFSSRFDHVCDDFVKQQFPRIQRLIDDQRDSAASASFVRFPTKQEAMLLRAIFHALNKQEKFRLPKLNTPTWEWCFKDSKEFEPNHRPIIGREEVSYRETDRPHEGVSIRVLIDLAEKPLIES